MSWNVWWRFGDVDWRRRSAGIRTTIARERPDLVGLQESWAADGETQAGLLAASLGMHSAFAVSRVPPPPDPATVDLGVALLSRHPIRWTREHALPGGDGVDPVALVAEVEHPTGPLEVVVACLDWRPGRAEARRAQTAELAGLLARDDGRGSPARLLMGDLNAHPGTPEIAHLLDVAEDGWTAPESGHTFSSANPYVDPGHHLADQRIDYVFIRSGRDCGLRPDRSRLVGVEPVDGVVPSDHYAVLVDVAVETPPRR